MFAATHLSHKEQVLFVVEVVIKTQNIVIIWISDSIDVTQQFDLIKRLVQEVLIILYHLRCTQR